MGKPKTTKSIEIDWSRAEEQQSGKYILPDQVLDPQTISDILFDGWGVGDVNTVLRYFKPLEYLPMVCKNTACDFVSVCPLAQASAATRFQNKGCPLEILDILLNFVRYTNELDVYPDDHTDLTSIFDLCRISVGMSRCDRMLALESPVDIVMKGTNVQTGLRSNQRAAHPAFVHQEHLRASRVKLEDALTASRSAKEKMRRIKSPKSQDEIINQMAERAAQIMAEDASRFAKLEG